MSDDRSEYTVNVGGVDHTMLLTSDDAERLLAKKVVVEVDGKARAAQNKARTAQSKD